MTIGFGRQVLGTLGRAVTRGHGCRYSTQGTVVQYSKGEACQIRQVRYSRTVSPVRVPARNSPKSPVPIGYAGTRATLATSSRSGLWLPLLGTILGMRTTSILLTPSLYSVPRGMLRHSLISPIPVVFILWKARGKSEKLKKPQEKGQGYRAAPATNITCPNSLPKATPLPK